MEGLEVLESFLRKQEGVKKWMEGVLAYELSSDDLWEQLKSGVDLCRLMLKLKEGYAFPPLQTSGASTPTLTVDRTFVHTFQFIP